MKFWLSSPSWWPWDTTQAFFASDFFAGLFGAGVGAIAAYLFASRSERRTNRLQEIARANAAIALSHSIFNTMIILKRQHTRELIAQYQAELAKAGQAMASPVKGVVEVEMNMMTLAPPYLPGGEVQEAVIAGVLLSPRAQIISIQLRQSVDSLIQTISGRNSVVAEFRGLTEAQKIPLFLGLAGPSGGDLRYKNFMEALDHNVDDCIYFAVLLQELLQEHIRRIQRKLWWRAPSALKFDYSSVVELLPDRAQFESFEREFRRKETGWEELKRFPKRWWTGV